MTSRVIIIFPRRLFYLIFRRLKNKKILLLILFILLLGFIGNLSLMSRQQIFIKYHTPIRFVKKLSDVFFLWAKFIPSDLPQYRLEINKKDLNRLSNSRPPTYQGINWTDDIKKISIPGVFIYNNEKYEVKVRYHGFTDNHWRDNKRSYYVEFKKDNLFFGQKAIRLIIPSDKGYIEYFNNYRAAKFNLITNPGKFVWLKINNESQGVYYEIQDWDKDFLEKVGKNSDSNLYTLRDLKNIFDKHNDVQYKYLSYWKHFSNEIHSGFENFSDLNNLLNLINNSSDKYFYRYIGDIVDLDNFFHWNSFNLLNAIFHQELSNSKLYFDSSLGKFQFIPFDLSLGPAPDIESELVYDRLTARILANPVFLHERNKILADYVNNDKNLTDDLSYFDELYKKTKFDFYKDFNKIETNFEFIKKVRDSRNQIVSNYEIVKDFLKVDDAMVEVDLINERLVNFNIINTGFSSAVLMAVTVELNEPASSDSFSLFEDSNNNNTLDKGDNFLVEFKQNDEDKKIFQAAGIKNVIFSRKDAIKTPNDRLELTIVPYAKNFFIQNKNGSLKGLKALKFQIINEFTGEILNPRVQYLNNNFFSDISLISESIDSFLIKNPIFEKGENNGLLLPQGTYNINQNIIVPRGTALKFEAGMKLSFAPGVSLISYSPVIAKGTREQPIIFTAQNTNKPWGVFGIIGAQKSFFDYTQFEHGGQAYINGVYISGMLALHFTSAEITNSQFKYATGDDGLNVKNVKAIIKNNYFYKNSFDGLDLDFNDSEVIGNHFEDNGNDGIDISGSRSLIRSNFVEGSGDKCISVGEESQPLIFNNILVGCNTGIALKDLSNSKIINNVIYKNKEGLSLYQKKPIFGGGRAEVFNTIIWGNKEQIKLDEKSNINIKYSDIEGGYKGEGNVAVKPLFDDHYLLIDTNDIKLKNGGNAGVLNQYIGGNFKSVNVGIFE